MSAEQQPQAKPEVQTPPEKSLIHVVGDRVRDEAVQGVKSMRTELLRRQSRWHHREEIHRAKEDMAYVIDAATTVWTDVLRFGPAILQMPEIDRLEENFLHIPERYDGYREMILDAYKGTSFKPGVIPPLTPSQLQTFAATLNDNLHTRLDEVVKSTWEEHFSIQIVTNSKGGVGSGPSHPVDSAMEKANIQLFAYSRLPERFMTDLRPAGLTVTTLAGISNRSGSRTAFPLSMLMLHPAFEAYERSRNN